MRIPSISTILFTTGTMVSVAQDDAVDFNRDVRPILTKNCTTCHGGVKKAGDVSYLYREDTLGKGESGKTIVVPGDPDASEMIRRILTADPDDRMPPPDHHPKPLPEKEIEILTKWIEQGAEWGTHWSFLKPEMPPLPEVRDSNWPRQDLDRFILSRLDSENLKPSPEAAPAEWLRRVSFDLTGLPPTLEEYEAFLIAIEKDKEGSYAAAADRFLASPAYGEKWAAMWLDLARYSDTFGFESDPHRDIWPFRDWVIEAFNEDMSYDDFTVKQLAGDLIENPEPRDLIASAFHRNTLNNTESGTDDEEYRMAAVIDRVNTTWTTWNATTFGCVQCHSHPYDPIPHEDYYRFLAFFNNSEDVDLNNDFPQTKVTEKPDQQEESVRLEKGLLDLREVLNDSLRATAMEISAWKTLIFDKTTVDPSTGSLSQGSDGVVISSGTASKFGIFILEKSAEPFSVIRVDILPKEDDPAKWAGKGAVISHFTAAYVSENGERRPIEFGEVAADFLAGPFDPNASLEKVVRSYDGGNGFGEFPMTHRPRTCWFIVKAEAVPKPGERLEIRIAHGAGCNGSQPTILPRFRISTSEDTTLVKLINSPERKDAWDHFKGTQKKYEDIKGITIPVMRERSETARRTTHVHIRGNRTSLGEVVTPGTPSAFDGANENANRLEMAEWLTGEDNPLAARTLANRLWHQVFGIGIVETLEDFGSSGALPSHPELLDFLALRLRDEHQWHLKPFLRELVLSSTYRQSQKATPEQIEQDPLNRLLARGPRNRLTAEMVRDQALHLSGLLSGKIGGPPVYPPQPEGIWSSVYSTAKWETSQGEDRYRRAIYTYNKRTSGYPAFLSFDASTRDLCVARRIATNTPLQALVTLNDPAHMELAQALAKRMAKDSPDLPARLSYGYRVITLKDPSPETINTLTSLHADIEAEYEKAPKESVKLASTPAQAALVLVANTLLNSDIALNR